VAELRDKPALDSQLESLIGETKAQNAAPDAPPEISPAKPAAPLDLTGEALAQQIQEMLDEATRQAAAAKAAANPTEIPSAELNADPRGDDPLSKTSMPALDDAIARSADDALSGDFQTVDDVLENPSANSAAAPQRTAHVEHPDPHAAPAPHGSDHAGEVDDALAGDMQSLEEALGEFVEPAPREAVDPVPAPGPNVDAPAHAGPVASRGDTTGEPPNESAHTSAHEPDAATHDAPAPAPVLSAAAPAPAPSPAGPAAARPARETRHEARPAPRRKIDPVAPLVGVLSMVNRPLLSMPQWKRDIVGYVGVELACVGVTMIVWARVSHAAATMTLGGLAVPMALLFYGLFMKRTPAAAPPTTA
jgi:hypothetical protein